MKLCGPNELGVAAAIGPIGETLDRYAEQALTEEDDQLFELRVAQVFICVLHCNLAIVSN